MQCKTKKFEEMTQDEKEIPKTHYGMLDNVKICLPTNLCFHDEYWLKNDQKPNLRQYANELFGDNRYMVVNWFFGRFSADIHHESMKIGREVYFDMI